MDDYFNIDITDWSNETITEKKTITKTEGNNYIYFYLSEGKGEINGIHFSGKSSSFVLYSRESEDIIINPISPPMNIHYKEENISRLITKIDFSTGGKFVFKKDFPLEFYTAIDGTKDATFSIQFLKLEYGGTEDPDHLIEIKAYILPSSQIDFLKLKPDSQLSASFFQGYFDKGHRVGKIVLRKEEIKAKLSLNEQNYLYIIISKSSSSSIVYTNVEGQYTFVPMDYTFSVIPESFYIFSNL